MRRLVSKSGERLFKRLQIKIFLPNKGRTLTRNLLAPPGQGFSDEGISKQLVAMAEKIEQQWPTEEYSLVATGPTSFNFVWRKTKEPQEANL